MHPPDTDSKTKICSFLTMTQWKGNTAFQHAPAVVIIICSFALQPLEGVTLPTINHNVQNVSLTTLINVFYYISSS